MRYQEKHRGVSDEGKEGREKRDVKHEAETQRVKRQTVDSRGLRREQKGRGRGRSTIKRGEIQGAYEGWGRARDRSLRARRRVKRRETSGRKGDGERARRKERRTPTSKKITIFAYVNYRLTRMNDRPRYFRPPVDSHQIDCLEKEGGGGRRGGRDFGRSRVARVRRPRRSSPDKSSLISVRINPRPREYNITEGKREG